MGNKISSTIEIVLPEQSAARGPFLMATLRALDGRSSIGPVLCQPDKVHPWSKNGKVFFYPTFEQAREFLVLRAAASLDAVILEESHSERYHCPQVWLRHSTRGERNGVRFYTQPWGEMTQLDITSEALKKSRRSRMVTGSFWIERCFLVQILATQSQTDRRLSKKYGLSKGPFIFELPSGGTGEIREVVRSRKSSGQGEATKLGYVVVVKSVKNERAVRDDIEDLMVLASLASRQIALFRSWQLGTSLQNRTSVNLFTLGKRPKVGRSHEPLLLRDWDECFKFLTRALAKLGGSPRKKYFHSAVFTLVNKQSTLETGFIRLFSALQSAFWFCSPRDITKPQKIEVLYRDFVKMRPDIFDDLWPVFDGRGGPSLYQIRSKLVHGHVMEATDFEALSHANSNLQWVVERTLLTAVGWDLQKSDVSSRRLAYYTSYQWKPHRSAMHF